MILASSMRPGWHHQNLNGGFSTAVPSRAETHTITAMARIKNAWVQISIPEPRLYLSEEEEASAAILLETSGELKPAQIQGIVHLVSHSVEGLEPERVTVVDTRGQVLSQDLGRETGFGLTTSQYEIQRRVERELEQDRSRMVSATARL